MPKLVVNPGTSQARKYDLQPGAYLVGRAAGNEIRIEDASISSRHAQIVVQGGTIMVRDMGSTNGSFINGTPIKQGELRPGQVLRLGWVEMTFMAEPSAAKSVTKMVEGIPVPNEIAAEALEAARQRRLGHKPNA